jgi:hypothetical protein
MEALGQGLRVSAGGTVASTATIFATMMAGIYSMTENKYPDLTHQKHRQAALHATTGIFAVIGSSIALFQLIWPDEALRKDPIYGNSPIIQFLFSFTVGFFVFELAAILLFYNDVGDMPSLMHAIACMYVYGFCQYPFLPWMGCFCLLFELSTPALKLSRFTELVDPSCTVLIARCRLAFAIIFPVVRIFLGVPVSILWQLDMVKLLGEDRCHSAPVVIGYMVLNVFLNALNLFWFLKIVKGAMKPGKKKIPQEQTDGTQALLGPVSVQ